MMTGLPGDTDDGALETARRLASLEPDEVRVYPTLVMADTPLEKSYRRGEYVPQSLDDAVALCAKLLSFFEEERGIPVIRLGLHAEEEMTRHCVAGPFHPAFRELCEGRLLFQKARRLLEGGGRNVRLHVHPSCVSRMVGHRRENTENFIREGYSVKVVADAAVPYGDVQVEEVRVL
jgi:histone acetyltransferase (RNA polymerase elongator complex component)